MFTISKKTGLVFITLVLTHLGFADIITVEGLDTDFDYRSDAIVVNTQGEGKWIGCTIFCDGEEIDLPVQSNSYVITFDIPNNIPSGRHRAVVTTWNKIVYDCGCYYCRKNGYHLEDEVDRKYFSVIR